MSMIATRRTTQVREQDAARLQEQRAAAPRRRRRSGRPRAAGRRPDPVVQRRRRRRSPPARGCSRRRARSGPSSGVGGRARADGADDREGARLAACASTGGSPAARGKPGHRSRSATRSTAAFEASPSRPGRTVSRSEPTELEAVDRPEADGSSPSVGRPGERPERLDRCCDDAETTVRLGLQFGARGRAKAPCAPSGSPTMRRSTPTVATRPATETESSAPHLQLIGFAEPRLLPRSSAASRPVPGARAWLRAGARALGGQTLDGGRAEGRLEPTRRRRRARRGRRT